MDNVLISSKPIEIADYKTYKEAVFLISVLDEWDLNGRLIPKEVGEKYHSTIVGFPIVAKLIRDKEGNPVDFRGHEMKIITNEDGSMNCVFDTVPIGSVLESWIENREVDGYEGKKDCIMIKAKLWSDRFPEYFTVLDKLWAENNVKSSWELTVEKCEKTIKGKIIKAFSFLGNCLLGSNVPGAVNSAGVYEYAQSDMNDESNSEFILASALSKDCEDFSDINSKQKEDENLKKSTQEVAEEEVIETQAETSEEKVEETTPVAEEVSEEENSENNEVKDNEISEEEKSVNENENTEKASLTMCDLRNKLCEAVDSTMRGAYVEFVFPAENYILVRDYGSNMDELDFLKITYTVENDVVSLGEPEKITLVVSISEVNAKIAEKDEAIIKANEEIQTLKTENETLLSYKKRCEKEDAEKAEAEIAEKQNKLKEYALNSKQISKDELETDEFKTIISELDEAKLKAIIADRVVASLSNKNESKVETSETKVIDSPKANLETVEDVTDYRSAINLFLGK